MTNMLDLFLIIQLQHQSFAKSTKYFVFHTARSVWPSVTQLSHPGLTVWLSCSHFLYQTPVDMLLWFLPEWGSAAEPLTPSEAAAGRFLSLSLRSRGLLPVPRPSLHHHRPSQMKEMLERRCRWASPWQMVDWAQRGSRPRFCSSWRHRRERGWWRTVPPASQGDGYRLQSSTYLYYFTTFHFRTKSQKSGHMTL